MLEGSLLIAKAARHVVPGGKDAALMRHRQMAMGQEAAQTILNAQVRVDEAALRRRSGDWLATILERIAEASG